MIRAPFGWWCRVCRSFYSGPVPDDQKHRPIGALTCLLCQTEIDAFMEGK